MRVEFLNGKIIYKKVVGNIGIESARYNIADESFGVRQGIEGKHKIKKMILDSFNEALIEDKKDLKNITFEEGKKGYVAWTQRLIENKDGTFVATAYFYITGLDESIKKYLQRYK